MEFHNVVRRVHEDPRVTAPYSPDQLGAHPRARASALDRPLDEGDVRLTMGGEPTFVSVDDMDAAGVERRRRRCGQARAGRRRWPAGCSSRRRDARAACCTHGQGKWYPGEPLPRWQVGLSLAGRRRAAVARPRRCSTTPGARRSSPPGSTDAADGCGWSSHRRRMRSAYRRSSPSRSTRTRWPRCSTRPGLPTGDPPARDVDPATVWLADAGGAGPTGRRDSMPRTADPVGWVAAAAPARRTARPGRRPGGRPDAAVWSCCRARRRSGLRLPLGSISWTLGPRRRRGGDDPTAAAAGGATPVEPVPSDSGAAVPRPGARRRGQGDLGRGRARRRRCASRSATVTSSSSCHRSRRSSTRSSCSPRSRTRPPAAACPSCWRGIRCRATRGSAHIDRDPRPWRRRGQRRAVVVLGRAGRLDRAALPRWPTRCGLGADKFALDGTHTGTGGGNHLTLGGPTPAGQSAAAPARPAGQPADLLAAPPVAVLPLLRAVHRPDQPVATGGRGPARDALRAGDRLRRARPARRIDARPVAGRSGRCATCSPTSPATPIAPSSASTRCTARTPSAAGSACSSCAASRCRRTRRWPSCRRCWCARWSRASGPTPYSGSAGPLGHRAARPVPAARTSSRPDIDDVVADLRAHGLDFEQRWLEPFHEFRFPRLGSVEVEGGARSSCARRSSRGTSSVRRSPASGTARYVDSSLERVQVAVRGAVAGPAPGDLQRCPRAAARHSRGRARWSQGCGTARGLRRPRCTRRSACSRRWSSTSSTAGAAARSAAAPITSSIPVAGPSTRLPVNAAEAESRRAARFRAEGHTPGPLDHDSRWRPAARRPARDRRRVPRDARPARAAGSVTDAPHRVVRRAGHPAGTR